MNPIAALLVVVLAVAAILALVRLAVGFVTVHDYERGLRYSRGRFAGLLAAGTYTYVRPFGEIRVLDTRPSFLTVEGQEVLTSDGVPLRISLVARFVVGDAVSAVTGDQDFRRALYLALQLGLRDVIAAHTADELLASRATIGPAVRERTGSLLAGLGLELLVVEARDLMVPGELKRAFAGVAAARKEADIALERARGETAALRNLANAARLLEDHPGLVQLRALQEVGSSSGNTIVLGLPDGTGGVVPAGRPARRDPAGRRDVVARPIAEEDGGRR